tara:strand:+ start:995 stop:1321 length:327 start_codon:yes stop_codon:yes gene_type:complete
MEVKGKLVKMLKLETGVSKSGKEWQKQTALIDNGEDFNNLVAISAFGQDKIKDLNKLQEGMTVSILCNVYSREYKGKYYHNIDGYWFTQKAENEDFVTSDSDDNDLPF